MNFETRLKVFFVLIVTGIIGIAAFTYHYYQSVKEVTSALYRSNRLHSVSQALLIDIQDMELSTRAYSLSSDSAYIPQYHEATTNLHSHLNEINSLTKKNPDLQRRLGTLAILIEQKIAYAEKLIGVTNTEGIVGASNFFKASPANDLTQHMRFTLRTIQSQEDLLIRQRNSEYESQLLNLRYTYYALLIALVVAVCIIGYFTVYQTRLRRIRERKLRQSEQQLEKRVSESLDEIGKQYAALREIAEMQSHQVRAPIATILGLINLLNFEDPADPNNADLLLKLKAGTEAFDQVIRQIVKMTNEIEGLKPENA